MFIGGFVCRATFLKPWEAPPEPFLGKAVLASVQQAAPHPADGRKSSQTPPWQWGCWCGTPLCVSPSCHPSLTCMLTGKDQANRCAPRAGEDMTGGSTEHSCRHTVGASIHVFCHLFLHKSTEGPERVFEWILGGDIFPTGFSHDGWERSPSLGLRTVRNCKARGGPAEGEGGSA